MIPDYNRTWENTSPFEKVKAPFVSTPERFLKSKRGLRYLKKQELIPKKRNYVFDGEYLYENLDEFVKFRNGKILVIGGGPSTRDSNWDQNNYDFIFTVNNFYKSDILKNIKIDLAFVAGSKVNTHDRDYKDYFRKNDTLIGVENVEDYRYIHSVQKNFPNKSFICSCRTQLKCLGATPKIIIFALCMGARQVDCVGLDGIPKGLTKKGAIVDHAFDGKSKRGCNYTREQIIHSFKILDYHLNKAWPDQTVNNLGAGHPYNCWSEI